MKYLGVIAAAAALFVLPVTCSVLTAPSRVVQRTLQTDNILSNYEFFHDANQRFASRVHQINQSADFLAKEGDLEERGRLRMELAAQQQSCRELVADYNANSLKINRSLFKDRGLPWNLDATQCEI